jgi:hypothetical protein
MCWFTWSSRPPAHCTHSLAHASPHPPLPQQEEKYTVTWDEVLANPLVETIEDPLHKTATAKTVYHDVYGA